MKRELAINIVLGCISLVIIGVITAKNIHPAVPTSLPQITPSRTISMSDFAKHNTGNDCWVRMNGNVYDVTQFLGEHPGGPERILPYCGGPDAAQAFATKGGRGAHSTQADQLLQQLLIGTLAP